MSWDPGRRYFLSKGICFASLRVSGYVRCIVSINVFRQPSCYECGQCRYTFLSVWICDNMFHFTLVLFRYVWFSYPVPLLYLADTIVSLSVVPWEMTGNISKTISVQTSPILRCVYLKLYLLTWKGGERERERDAKRKISYLLVYSANIFNKWGWARSKAGAFSGSPVMDINTRAIFVYLPRALAQTWINLGAARTQTAIRIGCQHCRWHLNLLHHSTGPISFSLIDDLDSVVFLFVHYFAP